MIHQDTYPITTPPNSITNRNPRHPSTTTLTHRHGSLPTLVDGLSLRLDDSTSSGYWGVEWCDTAPGFHATLDQRLLGPFRTAVQAAIAIARAMAVPRLPTLPVDILEIILRLMPDVTVFYKSSRDMRRILRPACYEIHLDSAPTRPRSRHASAPHGAIAPPLRTITSLSTAPTRPPRRAHLELGLPLSLPLGDMDRVERRLGNPVAVAAMLVVDKRVPTITTHPLQRRGMVQDTGRPPTRDDCNRSMRANLFREPGCCTHGHRTAMGQARTRRQCLGIVRQARS
jgi:hypothetical protein